MLHNRMPAPQQRSNPIRTLLGIVGVMIGIVFFLQAAGMFTFNITDPLYLKIFAVYAIVSGLVLLINIQRHGIIRY